MSAMAEEAATNQGKQELLEAGKVKETVPSGASRKECPPQIVCFLPRGGPCPASDPQNCPITNVPVFTKLVGMRHCSRRQIRPPRITALETGRLRHLSSESPGPPSPWTGHSELPPGGSSSAVRGRQVTKGHAVHGLDTVLEITGDLRGGPAISGI